MQNNFDEIENFRSQFSNHIRQATTTRDEFAISHFFGSFNTLAAVWLMSWWCCCFNADWVVSSFWRIGHRRSYWTSSIDGIMKLKMHIFLDKNILSVVLRVGKFCDSILPEEYFCCKLGGGVTWCGCYCMQANIYPPSVVLVVGRDLLDWGGLEPFERLHLMDCLLSFSTCTCNLNCGFWSIPCFFSSSNSRLIG